MRKGKSRGRLLILWLAVLATVLYTGCGVWTTGGKAQQEAIDQIISQTASLAAEKSSEPEASVSGRESSEPEEAASGKESLETEEPSEPEQLEEDGSYTTCEDVALYLEIYERLPGNFITKKEARDLGWQGGSLEPYAPGKCIGGDRFGNYEKLLPEAEGRSYKECDIDTLGADSRGAKRIVYSDDGLIYYTEDHYASFILLYD